MQLENFLCCFDLETGGFIIGWYHLFSYILYVGCALYFGVVNKSYKDISLILAFIVFLLVISVLIYICWELILGVKQRDHNKVLLFHYLCTMGLVANLIFALGYFSYVHRYKKDELIETIVGFIIYMFAQFYIFSVIESLYKKFKGETLPSDLFLSPNKA